MATSSTRAPADLRAREMPALAANGLPLDIASCASFIDTGSHGGGSNGNGVPSRVPDDLPMAEKSAPAMPPPLMPLATSATKAATSGNDAPTISAASHPREKI